MFRATGAIQAIKLPFCFEKLNQLIYSIFMYGLCVRCRETVCKVFKRLFKGITNCETRTVRVFDSQAVEVRHVYFVETPVFDPTKNCFFHESIRRKIAFFTNRSDKKLLFCWFNPTKNCFSRNQFRRKIVFVTSWSDEKLLFRQSDPTKNCFCKCYKGKLEKL